MTPRHCRLLSPVSCLLLLAGCPLPLPPEPRASLELAFNTDDAPTAVETTSPALFSSHPVFDTLPGRIGSHAPTVTALPSGDLLAAWYSYAGPHELNGAAIYTARRDAATGAWSAPALRVERPVASGNPVLYSEGDDVWLFQAVIPGTGWSTAHVELQRSFDAGQTWTAPVVIIGLIGSNVRHPPVRLADHTLLLPAYDDLFQRSLFYTSPDGYVWALRAGLTTTPANLQPSVVVLPSGRALSVMRNTAGGFLWVTASDDGGTTWRDPIDSGFPNPGSPATLLRLAGGSLMLIFNDDATARRPLSVTLSADDGRTWHPARALVTGEGDYAYPAAVQAADGTIHILYSHDRQHIQHITLNESWIVTSSCACGS